MGYLTGFKDLLIESLKENKKLILILYAIFIITFIASWLFAAGVIPSDISDMGSSGPGMGDDVGAWELFTHNAFGGIVTYLASVLFAIPAIVMLIYNGMNLGFIGSLFSVIMPKGGLLYIVYLIPHGIFEITATVLQSAAGILFFLFLWRLIRGMIKSDETGFKQKLLKSYELHKKIFIQSLVLLIFATILLIIAAPIEAYLSMPIAEFIVGA